MGKFWCVVGFEDGVQIVPQIWIDGDRCYWPVHIGSQKSFERAVREYRQPEESWTLHGVRIFGVYDSYELAVPKLKLAEVQSDLNTDEETSKKSRAFRKRVLPSSESEENGTSDEDTISGLKAFPKFPKEKDESRPNSTPTTSRSLSSSNSMRQGATLNSSRVVSTPRSCPADVPLTSSNIQPLTDCCRCCCKFDKDYKINIQNDLNEVKNQLKLVLQVLREESRSAIVNENKENFDDLEERLPIKSEEDVHIWETLLANKDEQKKMITFLSHIGGHETNNIVKNILRKLMTNSVASFYNWEGKKGKKMFSSLILSDCIRKAAILSPNAKGTTEQDIILAVKNWLRHASARMNNSKQNQDPE